MSNNDQHRLEVILEDINGKFNLVLEGHDALRKEFRDSCNQLLENLDRANDRLIAMIGTRRLPDESEALT